MQTPEYPRHDAKHWIVHIGPGDSDTRVATLTVTEGGYFTDPHTGDFLADDPAVVGEWETEEPQAVFGSLLEA